MNHLEGLLGAFVGRFQPLHRDHVEMILRVLDLHSHVIVGIANPDPAELHVTTSAPHRGQAVSNPFTYWERSEMVRVALEAEGVSPADRSIVPFPMGRPESWLGFIPADATQYVRTFGAWEYEKVQLLKAQYKVIVWEHEERTAEGAQIRQAMTDGRPYGHNLHPSTQPLVDHYLARRAESCE